jgi:hypothetical protein
MSARIGKPEDFELEPLDWAEDGERAIEFAGQFEDIFNAEYDPDLGWLAVATGKGEFGAWIGRLDGKLVMLRKVDGGLRELTYL